MADSIEDVIGEMEQRLAALREVAEKYPGCSAHHHEDISVWVVDMPHEACTNLHVRNRDNPYKAYDGFAILFKNVGPGVNIAPRNHYLELSLFQHYMQKRPKAMEEVAGIFKEHALP